MKLDTVIKNAVVINAHGRFEGWVGTSGERIAALGADADPPSAPQVIDAGGKWLLPGVVDAHCHWDWPDWPLEEGIRCTSNAVSGGVTTNVHMMIEPGSLVEGARRRKAKWEEIAFADATLHPVIFSLKHVEEIPKVAQMGYPSFKFFMPYRGSEAVPPLQPTDDGIIWKGMQAIAALGQRAIALVHCENIEPIFLIKDELMASGREDFQWRDVRPNFTEEEAMARICYFARITGVTLYIVHITIKEGPEILVEARRKGVRVVAETCPHYLTLAAEDTDRVLGKCNPPLRTREDAEALWKAVQDGIINVVGSDHAPDAIKHKPNFWDAIVGSAGLETLLPVMLSYGVGAGRISAEKLVDLVSTAPARTFGLFPKKGVIAPGSDADVVIVDPERQVTIRAADLNHISDCTPWEGKTVKGWAEMTLVRGQVCMRDGEITGKSGTGKLLERAC
ncbi:MAG: dihydroorotase family protein [Nitrospinota bacterium]